MDATPKSLNLQKDKQLDIVWNDGSWSVYPVSLLRTMCPCAKCRDVRAADKVKPRTSLSILPGNFDRPIVARAAELVGNYALRIDWSDDHGSGIYSFTYLRSLEGNATR